MCIYEARNTADTLNNCVFLSLSLIWKVLEVCLQLYIWACMFLSMMYVDKQHSGICIRAYMECICNITKFLLILWVGKKLNHDGLVDFLYTYFFLHMLYTIHSCCKLKQNQFKNIIIYIYFNKMWYYMYII